MIWREALSVGVLVKGKGRSQGLVGSVWADRFFPVPEDTEKGGTEGKRVGKESWPRAVGLSGPPWNVSLEPAGTFAASKHPYWWAPLQRPGEGVYNAVGQAASPDSDSVGLTYT